ncbi:ATP-binding protein [Arachidicoccus terrestris]|uniref:ATP-binding protein n=1 Tax=Arachidicoccus terrestris TaxID=2875539 RepID=UPI001CC484A8|nr:ATP-binding protein [Arachidicoccus terrestris]UAY56582.1 ATP-binding protein [Arachidicoccus terrestris]
MQRKYPIGLQSFREIRQGGYVYIDKTEIIHQLVETGKYYFLSRPRRFGKSLLVDTIEQLFSGKKELFEGLWIHDKWNWSQSHPVIHFDFSELPYKEIGLTESINRGLDRNAKQLGLSVSGDNIKDRFRDLIEKAALKGQVVILIDEYDKPIIDFLEEPGLMDTNRSIMKSFYSILKASDENIRFLLITGVSQFSQVSIFSDLNNLDNITLTTQYGGLVGITQKELEKSFAPEITELQKNRPDILAQIKEWYNGYTWNMQTHVYNPFSVLKFMKDPVFRNYWFATGTPSFLINILKKNNIYDVEGIRMGSLALSTFNPDHPNPGSLLFQTGYLTIKNISASGQVYELGYPNQEVKASLLDGLLSEYREMPSVDSVALIEDIQVALKAANIAGLVRQLNALIATIPYDHWKVDSESIFTIITFLTFKLIGVDVYTEVHSAKGRCDVLVKTDLYIFVIELKLDGSASEALQQIRKKGYLSPYVADLRKKLAVGISFSSENREVAEFLLEEQQG